MASVSSATSSLGNTSLRGFGGMVSGIDRDAIIEQMSLGTNTKIANKKKDITSAEWKQEAYREVIDQILNMEDKYYTYSSTECLLNRDFFSKNQVTALGDSAVTKYITASGNNDLLEYMSILGVKQTATSAYVKSASRDADPSITTGISSDKLTNPEACKSSKLEGMTLYFGNYTAKGTWNDQGTFTFPSTYKETVDGQEKTFTIDYTDTSVDADGVSKLQKQLNKALENSDIEIEGKKISELMEFQMDGDALKINYKEGVSEDIKNTLRIREISSAVSALGIEAGEDDDFSEGLTIDDFNSHSKNFEATTIVKKSLAEYMTGQKLSITYGGQTKQIELVTEDELKLIKGVSDDELMSAYRKLDEATMAKEVALHEKDMAEAGGDADAIAAAQKKLEEAEKNLEVAQKEKDDLSQLKKDSDAIPDKMEYLKDHIQSRINKAFGTDKVKVDVKDGNLEFALASAPSDPKKAPTLIVTSNSEAVREELGLTKTSNKISMGSSLYVNRTMFGFDEGISEEDFDQALKAMTINGVSGEALGISKDSTVNEFIYALNNNEDAGVKATFLSDTNQLVLISTETGSGRDIELTGAAKDYIFAGGEAADGQNAQMKVSYGNGITTDIESATNTFDLDGLKITVSGAFGYETVEKKDDTGKVIGEEKVFSNDPSKAVTFNAKADVDAATERVKKFIEAYNELVSKVDKEITTRPDSDYGPLTDQQKDEMDDTSIENWEKKAKEGLLFGDSHLRELSSDLQSMMVSLINDGINPNDLENIGISLSSDWYSGGELVFDETKFRQAMTEDPDKVADIMCGGGEVKTGLAATIGSKLSNYATHLSYKHNGSNGVLVEVAGTEKISTSLTKNQIYEQLKQMQEELDQLKSLLTTEQDRYIQQFTTMETLISQMNSQSSYLSSLSAG